MTDTQRFDWVQITEPRSREYMYINLTTGECLWEIPSNISFKKADDSEWWELFDANSARFYYYNARQQKTVWHRPDDCDIIPLAKLQTLKRRPSESDESSADIIRKEISTQTNVLQCNTQRSPVGKELSNGRKENATHMKELTEKCTSQTENTNTQTERVDNCLDEPDAKLQVWQLASERQRPQTAVKPKIDQSSWLMPDATEFDENKVSHKQASDERKAMSGKMCDAKLDKLVSREILKETDRNSLDEVRKTPKTISRHSSEYTRSTNSEFNSNFNNATDAKHLRSSSPVYANRSEHQTPVPSRSSFHGFAQESGGFRQSADSAALVATFQITPTIRPRAFPRTNPSYVGTYRRDRMPLYKRVDSQPAGYGVGNLDQSCKPFFDFTSNAPSNGSRRPISDGVVAVQQVINRVSGSDVFWTAAGQYAVQQSSPFTVSGTDAVCRTTVNHRPHSDGIVVPRYPTTAANKNGHTVTNIDRAVVVRDGQAAGDAGKQDTAATQHARRKSEPDYVNVSRNADRNSKASMSSFTDARTESVTSYAGLNASVLGRLSPNALYVNQQDLAMTAFSSRSACSFLEPITDGLPEFDFDDSDRSSIYSTPSPQSRHFQTLAPASVGGMSRTSAALTSYHPSLRKKKLFNRQSSAVVVGAMIGHGGTISSKQNALEKSWSLQTEMTYHRPMSLMAPYSSEMNVIANKVAGTLLQQMHIEQFVLENLNEHRKGILGKTVSVAHMLSWSKDLIQKPMIRTSNKVVKKEAPELFRLIQSYMGDRKAKESPLQLALDIAVRGWSVVDMRDEIYIQLCRQTTRNPHEDSMALGWELIGICLAFFPPSAKFYSYLDGHINKNIDTYSHICKSPVYHYSTSCQKRLQWIVQAGAKRGLKKPNIEEVLQAKKSLIEPSMFGNTLADIMHIQKERFPERRLPWIQTTLSEEVLRLGGMQTEGIFRIPGDIDEVNMLKVRCDRWLPPSAAYSATPGTGANVNSGGSSASCDPHVPASLLKLWYRELGEPLIPSAFYESCLDAFMRPDDACAVVVRLPDINRLALKYLVRFLQAFIRPEVVQITKMDVNNIAMVWAPNCLRGQSNDPKVIFENTRREMGFVRTLIQNLNTDEAEDLL